MDKIIQSVCVLTRLTERGVEELPLSDFNKISSELSVIFKEQAFTSLRNAKPKTFIKIGGKRFGIIYRPETLSTGQYVEIQTWMRSNLIENVNKIMASLVYPVKGVWPFWYKGKKKDHVKISEQILDCNFIDIHSACVFFSKLWRNSINSLSDYLVKEAKAKGMKEEDMKILLGNVSGGFLTPSELQTLRT